MLLTVQSSEIVTRLDIEADGVLDALVGGAAARMHLEHAVGRLLVLPVQGQVVMDADFRDADRPLHLLDIAFHIGL